MKMTKRTMITILFSLVLVISVLIQSANVWGQTAKSDLSARENSFEFTFASLTEVIGGPQVTPVESKEAGDDALKPKPYLTGAQTTSGQDAPTASDQSKPAHPGGTLEEINNKLNNPGSDLASLNFKFTWNEYKGHLPDSTSQDSLTLNFQPVFPFPLDNGANILVRPTIPVTWQPKFNGLKGGFDEQFGIGDSQIVAFYSRTNREEGYMWGIGGAAQFPTHTDDSLGVNQFQAGPAAFAGLMGKWGSAGVFPQHLWNVCDSDKGYSSATVTQAWYWFSVFEGWQVGGSPIIIYDWAADNSDQAWVVPVNLGLAKTIMIGETPVKLKIEGIYYLDQPDDFGPHWGLQFTITPVISNPFAGLIGKK